MNARDAFILLCDKSGLSRAQLSKKIGRSRNFLSSYNNKKVTPGFDIYLDVADVCGFDLILRNRETGEEIMID